MTQWIVIYDVESILNEVITILFVRITQLLTINQ